MPLLAEVAVLLPAAGIYTYLVAEHQRTAIAIGRRVWVPVRRRHVEGVVVALTEPPEMPPDTRTISQLLDAPALDDEQLALGLWMARYYQAPPGEALALLLPPGGRASETRLVQLTPAGRAAAAALGQALEPWSLASLNVHERSTLAALAADADEPIRVEALDDQIQGAAAALAALEEQGLVALQSELDMRQPATELRIRLGRRLADDAFPSEPLLRRSPRRQALYRALRSAADAAGPDQDVPELGLADLRAIHAQPIPELRRLAQAGLIVLREVLAGTPGTSATVHASDVPPVLTADQEHVLATLLPALGRGRYAPFLLHGVTGSGKTEVYLHAIAAALERGLGALVIVPEIALTPQLAARFRRRFGERVAVLHSALGDRERLLGWARLREGVAQIALGARSAVFAPVRNLGIVAVDEEHDPSFKQEDGVRYHARDVALRRARHCQAVAVLGSATPSIELYDAALAGRLTLLELPRRATPRPLPSVEIVDLRLHRPDADGLLSARLTSAIREALAANEQVVLFINRRGFATFVLCRGCGHQFTCPNCSVTLTYHRITDRLDCHYCGHLEAAPVRCPSCQAKAIERLGLGTEKVAALLAERFPAARIARLDRDTAQGRGIERVLDTIRSGQANLIVGTQMITKGHDFPGVTLVGVLLADQSMNFPDFRAAERTFQLLAQVAGRAGRGERAGRVLIQTFTPGHPAIVCAEHHDYARFFAAERAARQPHDYPPFARLAMVRFDGPDPAAVEAAALAAGQALRAAANTASAHLRTSVRGPAQAPLSRLKGRTRWQLLIGAADSTALRILLKALVPPQTSDLRLSIDVDPMSML